MKKLYWVNILIFTTLLLVSCASIRTIDTNVFNTAMNLANKQVELGNYQSAIDTYDEALKHGNDYRLLYNKSIVQAMNQNYKAAIETAKIGTKQFKDKSEFVLALAQYYFYDGQIDNFVNSFEKYFEKNKDDKESRILYMKLCHQVELNEKAYNIATDLWKNKVYNADVINVLFDINPDEWKIVHSLFN